MIERAPIRTYQSRASRALRAEQPSPPRQRTAVAIVKKMVAPQAVVIRAGGGAMSPAEAYLREHRKEIEQANYIPSVDPGAVMRMGAGGVVYPVPAVVDLAHHYSQHPHHSLAVSIGWSEYGKVADYRPITPEFWLLRAKAIDLMGATAREWNECDKGRVTRGGFGYQRRFRR